MRKDEVRRLLDGIEIPEENEARSRAWEVVRRDFEEREPAPRRGRGLRPVLVAAAVVAVVAGALSPAGRALIDSVRETIGVEQAAPALFDLPAEGRVLVSSSRGTWVLQEDGSRRLLGRYREASWSPRGLFVAAARPNELVALEPTSGDLRWSLARRDVRFPRWAGVDGDTRIAYLSGASLRVVAGDGTGDAALADAVAPVAPAWRPGGRDILAFATKDGFASVYEIDRSERYWRSRRPLRPLRLEWSHDGDRLLVVSRSSVLLVDTSGRRWRDLFSRRLRGVVLGAAFRPGTHRFAVAVRVGASRSEVVVLSGDSGARRQRRLFTGTGRFTDLAWSPDGRWLLVAWQDADQWVFIRAAGSRRLEAVSAISAQFRARRFPTLAGWCCAAS